MAAESLNSNKFSGGDDSVGPQISSKEPGIRPWALGTCEPPGSISSNTFGVLGCCLGAGLRAFPTVPATNENHQKNWL